MQQLEGTVVTDRAGVGAAQLNLSYSKITAPIDGRVGLRTVDVGNYVATTGAVGIATITTVTPIDVVFTLPADTVTKIQQRVGAGATLPTTVLDRTRTSVLGQGTFLTLDNQIDPTTGTIRAKARFANEDIALFPSQFVNVQLQVDVIHDAVVVPATAIRHGPNGDYVYVVDAEQVATMRPVTVGPASDDAISHRERPHRGRARRDRRRRPAHRRQRACACPMPRQAQAECSDGQRRARTTVASTGATAARAAATSAAATVSRAARRNAARTGGSNGGGPNGKRRRCRPSWNRDEPVAALHPAAGRHVAADARDRARRPRRLPLPAAVGAAAGRLPDDPGADALSRARARR